MGRVNSLSLATCRSPTMPANCDPADLCYLLDAARDLLTAIACHDWPSASVAAINTACWARQANLI